jgi:hypothetical protein
MRRLAPSLVVVVALFSIFAPAALAGDISLPTVGDFRFGQTPSPGQLVYCQGVQVIPEGGTFSGNPYVISDSSCVINLYMTAPSSYTSAFIERSSDGGSTWSRYFNAPDFAVASGGTTVGVAFGLCPLGPGTWLLRVHALSDAGDLYSDPYSSAVTVQCDTTAPQVTGTADRPPDANGWYRSPVTIHWNAVDPDDATVPIPADTLAATEGANVLYTSGSSCDAAGNCSTGSYSVSLDEHVPVFTCATADGLWHASNVDLGCTAGDALSGLATASDANFALSTTVPAGSETADAATGSHEICDVAGNCVTAGPIGGNQIDRKAPSISVTTPTAGASYKYKQPVAASFSCVDGGSGTAPPGSCVGSPLSGGNLDTTVSGARTFIVNSSDAVGNTASPVTRAYSVLFTFVGFATPLKNAPTYINVVQSGRGVPVPFSLRDYFSTSIYGAFRLNIFAGAGPSSTQIACPSTSKNTVSQTTTLSGLRYLSSSAQYEYDWPTSTSWKGTCRALTFKFKDGTSQVVNFQFK